MRSWVAVIGLVVVGCGDDGGAVTSDAPAPDAITLPTVEAYAKAWDEPEPGARRRLLEYAAVETLSLYEPTRMFSTREGVYGAISEFHAMHPMGTVPIVGNVREKHGRVWLRWRVLDGNGSELAVGLDLIKRAADQRVERVHSFFGTLPFLLGTDTSVQQALFDAWNETDPTARMMLLSTAVTDNVDVLLDDAPAVVTGRDAFATQIGARLAASPGVELSRTTGYLAMPSGFHAAWQETDGTVGVMMALLASDGRISELVMWTGVEP